jgi:hypothetical protein
VRALLWPPFALSASAQPATVVEGTTGQGLFWPLFPRSAWAEPATVMADTTVEEVVLTPVHSEAWAQSATEVAGTKFERAALASVRLVGESSASHCVGGHYRCERCSGLCSVGRLDLRQPLLSRARLVKVMLWPMFAWSARTQAATVVTCTKVEGVTLTLYPKLCVGSASHCDGSHDS